LDPRIFTQMFTVISVHHDNAFAFVNAVLVSKSKVTYTTVSHHIKLRSTALTVNFLCSEIVVCDTELVIKKTGSDIYFEAQ
jgi:hypothetical protein